MKELKNFAAVHKYLSGLLSETRSRHEAYTLDRMQVLMEFLGNPQDSYKTVHVAGTSGKSSTCYYLSSLLCTSGKKVGLTVSPHIEEVNERVQINGRPLGEAGFCAAFSRFLLTIQPSNIEPTYFELLAAFALWQFAQEKVDYAVVEVGLGGLLDGTNVMHRSDKICVITDIGFDHTATLGNTLTAITSQKAGIILPGNNVFTHHQPAEVLETLKQACHQKEAALHIIKPQTTPRQIPLFQQRNWQLACAAYEFIVTRDSLPQPSSTEMVASADILIPARMETFSIGNKTIILDGAHNAQKLDALTQSVRHAYPNTDIACLIGFARIHEPKIHNNLEVLLPMTSSLIITSFHDPSDDHHATNPVSIAHQCLKLGYHDYTVQPDLKRALALLLAREEPVLVVTGSFFLLQHVRPLIMKLA